MSILDWMLAANDRFVRQFPKGLQPVARDPDSKMPRCQAAIITCMDTRLVDFLEPAIGIRREEAIIIKNAGNTVTGFFESTIRSLIIAIFELGIKEIFIIGHDDCGMGQTDYELLKEKMIDRGVAEDAIILVEDDLTSWLDKFHHPEENVKEVVRKIRRNPFIPKDVLIHGLVINPYSGQLRVIDTL